MIHSISKFASPFWRVRKNKPFANAIELEMRDLLQDMEQDVNRQVWGDQEARVPIKARKMPRLWAIEKHFHRHSGKWAHVEGRIDYDDCEYCGQPVKTELKEYWYRRCEVCGAYEQVDKIPVTHKRRLGGKKEES